VPVAERQAGNDQRPGNGSVEGDGQYHASPYLSFIRKIPSTVYHTRCPREARRLRSLLPYNKGNGNGYNLNVVCLFRPASEVL
jgi:hypothetical protein